MRRILILLLLAVTAISSPGCIGRNSCNPCSTSAWRPSSLFGFGRRNPTPVECCDPCGGATVMSGQVVSGPVMTGPVMTGAPCCQ